MAVLPSKNIFPKQDTMHPLIISLYFLEVTIPLIYLSMRVFSYTWTDLQLAPSFLLSLYPHSDLFSRLFIFPLNILLPRFIPSCFLPHFLALTSPLAKSSIFVLILFPSLFFSLIFPCPYLSYYLPYMYVSSILLYTCSCCCPLLILELDPGVHMTADDNSSQSRNVPN